jgi:hypothetical protein
MSEPRGASLANGMTSIKHLPPEVTEQQTWKLLRTP